ncbi:MAG: hypothetical protein ACXWQR_04925 [Ktedonobacterales bacterium]
MTPQQQSELDNAIARAKSNHVSVIAQGHFRDVSCDRFFLVTSASSATPHVVRLSGHHLLCDCPASQHGRICVHRASVHTHLTNEAVRKQRAADAVGMAIEAEQAAARDRVVLYRDTGAIDIFKH